MFLNFDCFPCSPILPIGFAPTKGPSQTNCTKGPSYFFFLSSCKGCLWFLIGQGMSLQCLPCFMVASLMKEGRHSQPDASQCAWLLPFMKQCGVGSLLMFPLVHSRLSSHAIPNASCPGVGRITSVPHHHWDDLSC